MSNKFLILDIETSARDGLVPPKMEASKVLKDPEKIAADIEKKQAEWLADGALHAERGQIILIGLLNDTGSFLILEGDEKTMLEQFWAIFGKENRLVVGHCIKSFDIPYIVRRSWILGVLGHPVMNGRYLSQTFVDTMEAWACGTRDMIGLDALSKALGFNGKNGDGKYFANIFKEDKEKAYEYLKNDLTLTRDVAMKMRLI